MAKKIKLRNLSEILDSWGYVRCMNPNCNKLVVPVSTGKGYSVCPICGCKSFDHPNYEPALITKQKQ